MTETFQPRGRVTELDFGYNAKTGVYTNSRCGIPKLGEIATCWRRIEWK